MVPSARRNNESTITIRVKDVTIIRIAGARERTVISKNICITTVGAPDSALLSNPTLKNGVEMTGSAAPPIQGNIKSAQIKKKLNAGRRLAGSTALSKATPALL